MILHMIGIINVFRKARNCLLSAVDYNDNEAIAIFGECYYLGNEIVEKDRMKAFELFNRVGTSFNFYTAFYTADMYISGEYGEINYDEAVRLYEI